MNIKRILAAVLAATMLNVSNVTALAATDIKRAESENFRSAWGQRHADRFDELLETGVVTQSTYDKIKEFLDENTPEKSARPERWNTLERFLQAGIITQTEYDALKTAMASPTKRPEGLDESPQSNPYSRFVTDGLISEETAAAMMEYLKSSRPQKTERIDVLTKMLETGVITQDEYDDIKANIPERSMRAHAIAN